MKELKVFLSELGMIVSGFGFLLLALLTQVYLFFCHPKEAIAGIAMVMGGVAVLCFALVVKIVSIFIPVDSKDVATGMECDGDGCLTI